MKARSFFSLASLTLGLFASSASAQLTGFVEGISTEVRAKFTFWVDPVENTLTVEIDNRYQGAQHTRGTITAFGFDTPFAGAGGFTLLSQTWNVLGSWHRRDTWSVATPFAIKNQPFWTTEVGVRTTDTRGNGGNPRNGVQYGDVVTFKFGFNDFTAAQSKDFFSGTPDVIARFQSVKNDCYSDLSDRAFADFTWEEELPPVPEPSTYGLMAAGALLLGVVYRRRARKS